MVLSDMRHQYYRKVGQAAQSHHVSSTQNMTKLVMITDMCPAQPGFNATLRDSGDASGFLCADGRFFNTVGRYRHLALDQMAFKKCL